jgi:aminopeptidase-like protein
VIDFRQHNLHVVNYSSPVRQRMSLEQLRPHLHSLPDHPEWIPYRTSYYSPSWGFCLAHKQLEALVPGEYDVCIDATLAPGSLTFAEAVLPGESSDEVLIYTHICHPSLCNDNLSAIAVAALLAQHLAKLPRALTWRFVFAPTTIGSITWLARNEQHVGRIRHGLVLASLGDRGPLVYKQSQRGDAEVDRVVAHALKQRAGATVEAFSPYGYDERQFCSPGFNLPVGRLSRTPNGRYPEYHTSADNLDFVTAESLGESLQVCIELASMLESNRAFLNLAPKCEPRLGPRNLFRNPGGRGPSELEHAVLWVLNQSNGTNDLLQISMRSGISYAVIMQAAHALRDAGLLRQVERAGA